MKGRALRVAIVLAVAVPRAHGQIVGADCTYPPAHDGTKLCVPKFCDAPTSFKELYSNGYMRNANPPRWRRYEFSSENKDGQMLNVSFEPKNNLRGYNLNVICRDVIHYEIPEKASTSPAGPPPPLYSVAGPQTPTGCASISPLPTLLKAVDLDLIAVWVILIIYLFYMLALVCEEFLVPAINIVCEKTGIPDDVAGATLLAAGCNSPEFFASIIGIFVADSTVGVGTVLGSAPFNLCCITAGATLAVGGLLLDPWLMARELLGLFFALILFLVFMDDYRVEWWEAMTMVLYYVCIYVPTLAYFQRIKLFILRCLTKGEIPDDIGDTDSSMLAIDHLKARSVKSPGSAMGASVRVSGKFNHVDITAPPMSGIRGALAASLSNSLVKSSRVDYPMKDALKEEAARALPGHRLGGQSPTSTGSPREEMTEMQVIAPVLPYHTAEREYTGQQIRSTMSHPVDAEASIPEMTDHEKLVAECRKRIDAYPNSAEGFSGVLMKKPRGFTKVRVRGIKWQNRHFVLDNHPTNPLRYSHEGQKTRFITLPLQVRVAAWARSTDRCQRQPSPPLPTIHLPTCPPSTRLPATHPPTSLSGRPPLSLSSLRLPCPTLPTPHALTLLPDPPLLPPHLSGRERYPARRPRRASPDDGQNQGGRRSDPSSPQTGHAGRARRDAALV